MATSLDGGLDEPAVGFPPPKPSQVALRGFELGCGAEMRVRLRGARAAGAALQTAFRPLAQERPAILGRSMRQCTVDVRHIRDPLVLSAWKRLHMGVLLKRRARQRAIGCYGGYSGCYETGRLLPRPRCSPSGADAALGFADTSGEPGAE